MSLLQDTDCWTNTKNTIQQKEFEISSSLVKDVNNNMCNYVFKTTTRNKKIMYKRKSKNLQKKIKLSNSYTLEFYQ
jgi:hypothetical protein